MPRTAQPRYDPTRNQWYLNHRRKKHFLCSGKGNYVDAIRRASEIMGQPAIADQPPVAPLGRGGVLETWIPRDRGGDGPTVRQADLQHVVRHRHVLGQRGTDINR
jgi:hypothetical protein